MDAAKGIFHTRSRCPRKIKVSPPFSVIEDSWGTLGIWARLEALDDVKADVPSKEESYVFQQRAFYFTQEPVGGSGGVWRKIEAHTTGNLRGTAWRIEPANALPGDFRAWETRTVVGGRTWPSEYYYLSSDAKIAIYCSPKLYPGGELVPNPYCYADVKDDSGRFLFNARFPIHASDQLMDIVQAGRRLFAPATDVCSNNSMESGSRNIQDDAMLAETASR